MSTSIPADAHLEQEIDTELQDLRVNLLPSMLVVLLGVGWFWFFYIGMRRLNLGIGFASVLLITVGSYAGLKLRRQHYTLACWVALLSLWLLVQMIAITHPDSLALAFGVVPIVAAHSLLGPGAAVALCSASIMAGLGSYLYGIPYDPHLLVQINMLQISTCVLAWVSTHPLRTTAAYALSGWHRVREALEETRTRRGEVYRALRALEEATFRIERANNELIVAQHEAQEARDYKEQLATTVSHELRGPLNLILGFVRLMVLSPESYGEPLPPAYREDLYTVYRNTQHLVALIDDILDLSKIEAQRLPLAKTQVNLITDVLRPAVEMVQPLVERKGLYLHEAYDDDLPQVFVDPVRVRQAVLNVLINAMRVTTKGGITISATRDGCQVGIHIRDTGPGIPAHQLPSLFREFSQLRQLPAGEPKGSGLGLAISQHLLQLHGGRIKVESEDGVGTEFHLRLPLDEQAASPSQVSVGSVARTELLPEHVIVIHNDPQIVRALSRYLEGYRVTGLSDLRNLPRLLHDMRPRALIASQGDMPAIKRLLLAEKSMVSVIYCDLPHTAEPQSDLSIYGQFIKPVSADALLSVMRELEQEGQTKVMLVDDDPDTVRLLERMLTSVPRPYRIIKAYDGQQALELMHKETPDVLLIDLYMPDMTGLEVIGAMRRDVALSVVKVVIVSASAAEESELLLRTPLIAEAQYPLPLSNAVAWLRAMLDALSSAHGSDHIYA